MLLVRTTPKVNIQYTGVPMILAEKDSGAIRWLRYATLRDVKFKSKNRRHYFCTDLGTNECPDAKFANMPGLY